MPDFRHFVYPADLTEATQMLRDTLKEMEVDSFAHCSLSSCCGETTRKYDSLYRVKLLLDSLLGRMPDPGQVFQISVTAHYRDVTGKVVSVPSEEE